MRYDAVCANCVKSGRSCPGYLDSFDLVHRSQTASTKQKCRPLDECDESSTSTSIKSSDSSFPSTSSSTPPTEQQLLRFTPNYATMPDIFTLRPSSYGQWEDSVIATFAHEYVNIPCALPSLRGIFNEVLPMYARSSCNSSLQHSFKALAFGSVLMDPNRRHLKKHGKFYYGQALKTINNALRDPEHASSDETLMSILICSICEVCHVRERGCFSN